MFSYNIEHWRDKNLNLVQILFINDKSEEDTNLSYDISQRYYPPIWGRFQTCSIFVMND